LTERSERWQSDSKMKGLLYKTRLGRQESNCKTEWDKLKITSRNVKNTKLLWWNSEIIRMLSLITRINLPFSIVKSIVWMMCLRIRLTKLITTSKDNKKWTNKLKNKENGKYKVNNSKLVLIAKQKKQNNGELESADYKIK
jgi:hypothetical protein